MQQFEMSATMEWLVEKVKGGTTGCENVRNLQPRKQHALLQMTVLKTMCLLSKLYQ